MAGETIWYRLSPKGAERDQKVHVAGAGAEGLPAGSVEARAEPELDRAREQQLRPPWKRGVQSERAQQHGQNERQRQDGSDDDVAAFAACRLRAPGVLLVGEAGYCGFPNSRAIARAFDRLDQRACRSPSFSFDPCRFGGEVDLGPGHPGKAFQRLLDAGNARRAGHSRDGELNDLRARPIASLGDGIGDSPAIHLAGQKTDLRTFGGKVHRGVGDAGNGRDRALDASHA
jgi:hypothetical protein